MLFRSLPSKPENKIIDFNNIDKILAILSDDNLLTPIFYESFISEIENYPNIPKIDFIYSLSRFNSFLIVCSKNTTSLSYTSP